MSKQVYRDSNGMDVTEEWLNFAQRVGEVNKIVKDLYSDDKEKVAAAEKRADIYLEGKVIVDENLEMKIKDDRTVINHKAFKKMDKNDRGEVDKDAWMAEVGKDADKRAHDRKVRREKADTLKTQATKAFRRQEYDKALSYYNRAIDQVRDNAILYCDRALTNIKLGNFQKVSADCETALRLNENSYKARLYKAKAHKELEEMDKYADCMKELQETFPQHSELTDYFLEKKQGPQDEDED